MFYSQFILAKKGPLGTIWIAAHLERKLRKNQVADTDIGVSVDSILFPEVPIALRLSSHLLLGVVRIYSRKVNYLFDDCSEALLKIKQAFRSTAVDLPPEESTAPYHSITLPETFDLDDFELPDNDIFQGNYVDHHVSTREQITLQDTMEGVVYSTSKFGLDERFGDGDTSQIGLDLDEDLILDKVGSPRHDEAVLGSDADPQAFVQPMTPLINDQNIEELTESSEAMPAIGNGNQIEGLAANTDFMEFAQAPSTPGLVEESNLANVQEALACDDHLETEDHNSTELKAKDNQGNASSESDHHGDKNAMDWSLINDKDSGTVICTPAEENGHLLGCQEINQVKPQGDSTSTAETVDNILSHNAPSASFSFSIMDEQVKPIYPVSECSGRIITASEGPDRAEDLQNGLLSNKEPSIPSTDQMHAECVEPQGIRLDGTVASPYFGDAPVLEDPCNIPCSDFKNIPEKPYLTNACQPVPEGISENVQASLKPEALNNEEIARNVEESCSPSSTVESNAVPLLGSPGRIEFGKTEAQACQEPKDSKILNSVVHENNSSGMHVLQACNSCANQPEMFSLGGDNSVVPDLPSEAVGHCLLETSEREEALQASGASTEVQGFHATDVMKPVLEANQISCEDIEVFHSKLDEQLDNAIPRDTQFENLTSSASSDLPAPEKLLSVPEGLSDLPNDMLVESTPDKEVLAESEGGGAGSKIISGKKRSFTESTLTVQSLNSVESFMEPQSKRIAESIPDDDDLLSSILVGRRTSVLKMKPTPPLPALASTKRPQSAPRGSASKRKVLMDDTMVLHGDTIRQQLTSTEDIRRVRKKAACTRPEVWMIQKQFLEDEIFSEPISIGMSTELICLHSQTYDLSGIRVSQNDENSTSFEAAKDMEFSERPNDTKETRMEGSTEPSVIGNDGKAQPAEVLMQTENQMGEDPALGCQDDDTQVQMTSITDISGSKISHELLGEITEMEIDGGSVAVADSTDRALALGVESSSPIDPVTGDICNVSACPKDESAPLDKTSGADASLQMDASCLSPDHRLETQSVEKDATVVDISNGKCVDAIEVAEINEAFVVVGTESRASDELLLKETEGGGSDEVRADVKIDCSAPTDNGNPSLATVTSETVGYNNLVVEAGDQAVEETRKNELGFVKEDEVLVSELGNDDKNPASNCSCSEEPKIDSLYSVELGVDAKDASLNGENSSFQEVDPQSIMDAEITALDHPAVEDRGEFENVIVEQNTEFLNVDDDDLVEENDDCMPSAEETRFLENSGWSSRTRAVAKYLQTLFDKEAEHGRKVLPMDNLLAGKTRKEASRMFFETLVLKTRDYIHVEQENPCDNIHIKPRLKLMKSDF